MNEIYRQRQQEYSSPCILSVATAKPLNLVSYRLVPTRNDTNEQSDDSDNSDSGKLTTLVLGKKFVSHVRANPADNSLVELTFSPEDSGAFYMHVLIGKGKSAIEISGSPFGCEILKSEVHKQLDLQQQLDREKMLEMQRLREEEERRRQAEREEAIRRRREEIMLRAQEAAKKAQQIKEQQRRKEEEDRQMRKELRTGGGFNLEKLKELREKQAKQ